MRFGHASHQIGLDVDVWLTPPPNRILTPDERESLLAVSMVEDDRYAIDPDHFGRFQAALIRRAAMFPEVERVFVNPGIKKALCATAGDGTATGSASSGPGGGTTTTCTSGCAARTTSRSAASRTRRRTATAAAPT